MASNLFAQNILGAYIGFYEAVNAGSITPSTTVATGWTISLCVTGFSGGSAPTPVQPTDISINFAGNKVSELTGTKVILNGLDCPYREGTAVYTVESNSTDCSFIYGSSFVVETNYTFDFIPNGVVPPNILSQTTNYVKEGTALDVSLLADKTISDWTIIGGADSALFMIGGGSPAQLRWFDDEPKYYDNPEDADSNNIYVVQVEAEDTEAATANATFTVHVQRNPVFNKPDKWGFYDNNLSGGADAFDNELGGVILSLDYWPAIEEAVNLVYAGTNWDNRYRGIRNTSQLYKGIKGLIP